MKFRSRKLKPQVGMEMTVTLSMREGQTVGQAARSILAFLKHLNAAARATKAVWIHVRCVGVPAELEEKLASAINVASKKPALTLVIDNTRAR